MKLLPIEIHDKARQMLIAITDYYAEMGGMSSVDRLLDAIRVKTDRISQYPESGTPESLLAGREHFYRSCILNRRIKMVYYADDSAIHVVAFWDMRMSPNRLRKTI